MNRLPRIASRSLGQAAIGAPSMEAIRWFVAVGSAMLLLATLLATTASARSRQLIFSNNNVEAVDNGPARETAFALRAQTTIAKVTTYHWNYGRGAPAGVIWLRGSGGEIHGPWQAAGRPGQGGVPSAYWVVRPNVTLPPGTYTVLDSDPATWAQNSSSGFAGMAWADGYTRHLR